ncbi:hypothetical protein SCHPADRAFT_569088 [Schizopora paradoxa]|uniref:Uncharacterized protein n=1 Tax=Schizopora paradoxa TaxID=27342 RepID=A0A0H2RIU6_9AGAM|nr:hypothetical protein SCHPADRAFT_569088 [Schizopora paradoxa]
MKEEEDVICIFERTTRCPPFSSSPSIVNFIISLRFHGASLVRKSQSSITSPSMLPSIHAFDDEERKRERESARGINSIHSNLYIYISLELSRSDSRRSVSKTWMGSDIASSSATPSLCIAKIMVGRGASNNANGGEGGLGPLPLLNASTSPSNSSCAVHCPAVVNDP